MDSIQKKKKKKKTAAAESRIIIPLLNHFKTKIFTRDRQSAFFLTKLDFFLELIKF